MRTITAIGAIITAALLATVTQTGISRAQYPQPTGSVAVTAAQTNVTVGGSVAITATLRDLNGAAVANQACTLSIASQPGTGASVAPTSAQTNANGVVNATVSVGTTPGLVTVHVTCGGVAGAITIVASAVATPTALPAATPASGFPPQSGVELPNTGAGATGSSSGLAARIGVGVAIVLLLGGAEAVREYRRRRT